MRVRVTALVPKENFNPRSVGKIFNNQTYKNITLTHYCRELILSDIFENKNIDTRIFIGFLDDEDNPEEINLGFLNRAMKISGVDATPFMNIYGEITIEVTNFPKWRISILIYILRELSNSDLDTLKENLSESLFKENRTSWQSLCLYQEDITDIMIDNIDKFSFLDLVDKYYNGPVECLFYYFEENRKKVKEEFSEILKQYKNVDGDYYFSFLGSVELEI